MAEHFWPWNPKAPATAASAARSRSAVSSTIIASLPPISVNTRLSQFCPGCTLAARSLMRMPVATDPVKLMKRVLGMIDQGVAEIGVLAGQEVDHAGREAGLVDALHELLRDDRRRRRRLEDDGVAHDHRTDGGADQDREQEVPGGDDHADPERPQVAGVLLAGMVVGGERAGQLQRLPRVVLAEVDGLRHVGDGLEVVLARLEDLPGGQLLAPSTQHGCELHQRACAMRHRQPRPGLEGLLSGRHGALDLGALPLGAAAHDAVRIAGIDGGEVLPGVDALAADHERVVTPELGAHRVQRALERLARGGVGEVQVGFGLVGFEQHCGVLLVWMPWAQPAMPRSTNARLAGRSARRRLK